MPRSAARIAALWLALGAAAAGCASARPAPSPAPARGPSPAPPRARPPAMGTAPFKVCTLGFHSPHELAAIRSRLPPKEFDFVDLTPAPGAEATAPASAPGPRSPAGWLLDRCTPDLRCDIVVFSGEFAGGFFGSSGVFVNLQELEEASCQPRCRGLFHDPREVFLLACNTLATKGADDRTPDQYLTVLLAHGFSRADAERVVALRYGPLGPSFRESLRRIFMGVPRIYGFSSVAPFGEITAPLLHRYFQRKGDYGRYLAQSGRDTSPNKELLGSFEGTSLVQTTGVTPGEAVAGDRAMVCALYDETRTVAERLRIVRRMFARPDFLSFVPTIEAFLERHPPEQFHGEERRLFGEIQSLEAPRRQMTELMYRMKVSAAKMQMAHLALQLGWITAGEFRALSAEAARQLLAEPLSTEVVNVACSLTRYAPAGAGLRSEDIPEALLWQAEGYRLIDCLSPADRRLDARMLAGLDNIDESTRLWAAYALSRRAPLDDAVLTALARKLADPSPEVRDRVRWTFAAHVPLSPAVLAAIRERDPALAQAMEERARADER